MVNNPLIRPYFLGGSGIGGVPLDSHEFTRVLVDKQNIGQSRRPAG